MNVLNIHRVFRLFLPSHTHAIYSLTLLTYLFLTIYSSILQVYFYWKCRQHRVGGKRCPYIKWQTHTRYFFFFAGLCLVYASWVLLYTYATMRLFMYVYINKLNTAHTEFCSITDIDVVNGTIQTVKNICFALPHTSYTIQTNRQTYMCIKSVWIYKLCEVK